MNVSVEGCPRNGSLDGARHQKCGQLKLGSKNLLQRCRCDAICRQRFTSVAGFAMLIAPSDVTARRNGGRVCWVAHSPKQANRSLDQSAGSGNAKQGTNQSLNSKSGCLTFVDTFRGRCSRRDPYHKDYRDSAHAVGAPQQRLMAPGLKRMTKRQVTVIRHGLVG